MENLTVIVPFWNGHKTIHKLIASIPPQVKIMVVDDQSDAPYQPSKAETARGVQAIYSKTKGYFTGAVNLGINACRTDVLVLNQDAYFTGDAWVSMLWEKSQTYAMIGERIGGQHPAWPDGYIHGTFMYLRRDALDKVGNLNSKDYPLWGSTCEYQLRVARAGYKILQLPTIPGFVHERGKKPYGDSITEMLQRQPQARTWFLHTPPEISVIIPCYNQGRFLVDAVNSLVGGPTSLGDFAPQTFQSFEVIIVDDASPDETAKIGKELADPLKGIRYLRRDTNGGTPAANNSGILRSRGKFVTVLCADDMMETDRLETLYRAAQADPSKVYYDDMQIFTDGQRRDVWKMQEYNFEKLLQKNHMHAGIFYPRAAFDEVGGYPVIMKDGREDWAMNVRLGVHGYCGKRIAKPGYLYRRQDHNRTLTNTTPNHHAKFLAQIQSLYPKIYKGARPDMCCGQSTPKTKAPGGIAKSAAIPMSAGSIILEYVGTSLGKQTFYGPVTGARYSAGLTHKLISVDPRDARTSSLTRRGLLDLSENGRPLFRAFVPPAPKEPESVSMETGKVVETINEAPVAEPQAIPDPEPTVEPVVEVAAAEAEKPTKKTRTKKAKPE